MSKWAAPNINLIFIEGLEENFRALQANIKEILGIEIQSDINGKFFFKSNEYPTINVACVNEEFQHVLATILNRVPGLIPSFCFIDPFGFSQTPFTLIERYMRNARAEIFLNFIYEETNRFLTWKNEKVQDHMKQHFGVESMEELHELIGENKGEDRKKIVVDYYSRKLTTAARINHVLNFEIKKGGRTKLILFYGTKSPHGLRLMKNVMWKVDDTGCFLYDDRKGTDQVVFEFVQDMLEEQLTTKLAEKIHQKYNGTRNIKIEQVEEFILFETAYPIENYGRNALKLLEEEQKRITSVVKIDGSKRKKGGLPEGFRTHSRRPSASLRAHKTG